MERQSKFLIAAVLVLISTVSIIYLYNINQESENWNYQELALFSHSESNFTFSFSGDERDDKGNFSRMINDINTNYSQVLFNINGGDLRSDAAQLEEFKKDYLIPGNIAHFNRPVLFVIGNHEIQGDPTESIYGSIFGTPTYYNFTENNSYFIIIDNADGQVDSQQLVWLKNQLKLSQKYKYRFVFMHIPLYTPNAAEENGMIESGPGGADALRILFDANNVTMIFASHIHNYYTGIWGKTPFIISGGAGAPPENNRPPNHHYILVNVTNNNVSYTKMPY